MLHILQLGERKTFGPFDVELVTLTHSIPEPNGLAIRTPLGMILHTGDWKIDADPLIGEDFDQAKIEELGHEGILAMVCDSTNVFEEGEAGSEGSARVALIQAVAEQTGRVAIASFASTWRACSPHVWRPRPMTVRSAWSGRSMLRIVDAARSVGILREFEFIEPEDAGELPAQHVLYLCTGSQGEPRAALGRIARDEHPFVKLGPGDTVIFSSRVIPGNERAPSARSRTSWPIARSSWSRPSSSPSTSRAIPAGTSCAVCTLGRGRALPCPCMASGGTSSSTPALAASCRCPRR